MKRNELSAFIQNNEKERIGPMTQKKLENDVPVTLEEIHVDVILLDLRNGGSQDSVLVRKARDFRSRIMELPCMGLPWRRMAEDKTAAACDMEEAIMARPFLYYFRRTETTLYEHGMVGIRLFVCGTLGRAEGLGFVRCAGHGSDWPVDPNRFMEDSWRTAEMVEKEIEKNLPGLDFGMELGIWIGTKNSVKSLVPIVFRPLKGRES